MLLLVWDEGDEGAHLNILFYSSLSPYFDMRVLALFSHHNVCNIILPEARPSFHVSSHSSVPPCPPGTVCHFPMRYFDLPRLEQLTSRWKSSFWWLETAMPQGGRKVLVWLLKVSVITEVSAKDASQQIIRKPFCWLHGGRGTETVEEVELKRGGSGKKERERERLTLRKG